MLLRESAIVVVLVGLAVAADEVLDQMRFGRQLAFASYRFSQESMAPTTTPVTIVDISDLKPENGITSRAALRDLLLAVAQHVPKVIGVDIDFSPEKRRPIDPGDPEFFDFCLRLQKSSGAPIVLGVDRTTGARTAEWLGADAYKSLAATMRIPDDTRHIPSFIAGPDAASSLRSLSVALADAYGRNNDPPAVSRLLQRARLISQFSPIHGVPGEKFLVDYSTLASLFSVRTASPVVLADTAFDELFRGRIVLLGDVAEAHDLFPVPNAYRLQPGVKLHAAAATTLVNEPLYEVTLFGRLILSAVLISAVLVPVHLVRARARTRPFWIAERLQGTLIVTLTLAALLGCGWIVRVTHIIWDGFFLAFFALAFHQPVHDFMQTATKMFGHVRTGLAAEQ